MLRSDIWINAYIARANNALGEAYVVKRGHDKAGLIIIVHEKGNNICDLYTEVPSIQKTNPNARIFERKAAHHNMTMDAKTAYLNKQIEYDPDLWVIEASANGAPFLTQDDMKSV